MKTNSNSYTFLWDENKNISNRKKHGVWFEEAQQVFFDPFHRVFYDEDHSKVGDERFLLVGAPYSQRILLVVFLDKNSNTIRIISARKATKREIKFYEKRLRLIKT